MLTRYLSFIYTPNACKLYHSTKRTVKCRGCLHMGVRFKTYKHTTRVLSGAVHRGIYPLLKQSGNSPPAPPISIRISTEYLSTHYQCNSQAHNLHRLVGHPLALHTSPSHLTHHYNLSGIVSSYSTKRHTAENRPPPHPKIPKTESHPKPRTLLREAFENLVQNHPAQSVQCS